jgi:hypothetical protein
MRETKGQPLLSVLSGTGDVLKQVLRTPATLFTAGLMLILGIYRTLQRTFWSILVTEKLQIPAQHLALYPFARSVTMLLFFFTVMPRLRRLDARKPMILGFLGMLLSHVILISVPVGNYWLLLVATILEAASLPLATTWVDKLVVVNVDAKERARIMAILNLVVIAGTSPFGWIGGQVSELNRRLPFVLNIVLFGAGIVLIYVAHRIADRRAASERVTEPVTQA